MYKNPIIIDAEAHNLSMEETAKCVEEYCADDVRILATGSHPSAHIQQKDAAIKLGKLLKNKVESAIVYDYLPFNPLEFKKPRWDLLNMNKYRAHNWHCWGEKNRYPYGAVYTSISCPYNCEFCCIKDFYKQKYQIRPIEDVINDFTDLYENHNCSNIKIMDELFVTKSKRTLDILDELGKTIGPELNIWAYARIDTITQKALRKMRKGGLRWLALGIESGNEEIRKEVVKGNFSNKEIQEIIKMVHDEGIQIVGNYMFGFWNEALDTMWETLEFAIKLNTAYANFYCTVAYPGSKLYKEMKEKGITLPTKSTQYAQMSPDFLPLPTKYLTSEEVLEFRDEAFNTYFNRPRYFASIANNFGREALSEVVHMSSTKIERNPTK
jgi:radical SAM superfamily enzyme YgiQ (UPF0313 family)